MRLCPLCSKPLQKMKIGRFYYYHCNDGHGELVSYLLIKSFKGTEKLIATLKQMLRSPLPPGTDKPIPCPDCGRWMTITPLDNQSHTRIDQCANCREIWFDSGEFHRAQAKGELEAHFPTYKVPEISNTPEKKPLELISQKREGFEVSGTAYSPLVYFGIPIEDNPTAYSSRPIGTFFLLMSCVFFSAFALRNPGLMDKWIFDPANAFRFFGLTVFTSSLIHTGWMHLIGNMYFLWMVGDNVEDREGPWFVIRLFFVAGILAVMAERMMGNTLPSLGASAGVTALFAYYAILFPKARIHFGMWMFYAGFPRSIAWSFNARTMALIYFGLQAVFAALTVQMGLPSNISYIGHIAGGLTGVSFYLFKVLFPEES